MHESQLIRDLLIYIFPKLTPEDFPAIDFEQTSDAWFETWLDQYPLAQEYVVDCEYQDWANAFDLKLNFLDIHQKPIAIDQTLDEIYDFFEHLQAEEQAFSDFVDAEDEHQDLEASLLLEEEEFALEEDQSFYFEPNDDILELTVVIVENLLNTILRSGFNVIAMMHPHKFQFILSHADKSVLQDLSQLFEDAYSSPQVRLFLSAEYSHHQFNHLIGKL
jgi:hypothetical protein